MSVERQLMMSSGGVQQIYPISNSLRFRASASAYLNRTPASAGNQKTWTWSGWVKRGLLGASSGYVLLDGGSTGPLCTLGFYADQLRLYVSDSGVTTSEIPVTTAVFRDPSAWYHCVCAVDTTQATISNRVKFYVNGVLQTITGLTGTLITQNSNLGINRAVQTYLGVFSYASNQYFDGYLTEINFIDGQALTPSSFGETSSTTGVWIPKKYTGSYGTNGFYLNFSNNTSTTALGYDTSGNGNNWTPNNFSLTTGSTYDSMIDSPTSYASGTNNVGNYAVMNPLKTGANLSLSNANLFITASAFANSKCLATIGVSSGKWYWEVLVNAATEQLIGIAKDNTNLSIYLGGDANSWSYSYTGAKYTNGTSSAYGAAYTTNDLISIALDMDAGTIVFYKNNVSQGTAYTGLTGALFPAFCSYASGSSMYANFGQRPFAYTPPSGYKTLCTYNLPAPTIVQGNKYMDATLYTGTGASQTIVNAAAFQPDFVWVKDRTSANNHGLFDSVRGVSKALRSNLTDAEDTASGVTAFNTNGFTLGSAFNQSSNNFIGWQWKAGGTAVTNTDGSITSSVSANQTAGFSVVTYTGTGVAGTIGHGLGVALSMIIIKSRTGATTDPAWIVGHTGIVMGSGRLVLNSTAANSTSGAATLWNSTAATGSVFSLGNYVAVNESGSTYVAYCFAAIPGYSAFGSYTGNGSADGPFVYLGFRPKFVLIKRTDTSGYPWVIFDTSRSTYNVVTSELYPNDSAAEANSSNDLDIVSNGFKIRISALAYNASGGTYIYAAFAENPFKNALAR